MFRRVRETWNNLSRLGQVKFEELGAWADTQGGNKEKEEHFEASVSATCRASVR